MIDERALEGLYVPSEIRLQPDVIRRVVEVVDPLVEPVARDIVDGGLRDIVMTGCGDSLFSAMAAAFSFLRLSGRLTVPMHALEYARAFYRTSGPHTLLTALSYSGETRRTLEAAIAARSRDAYVLAVTVDETGSLGRQAHHVLPNVSPREAERSNCRTGSFQAAYLALVLLAGHVAAAGDPAGSALLAALRDEIRTLADAMESSMDELQSAGRAASEELRTAGTIYYLGGGEAFAGALYGAAKLYETSSLPAVPQETEQFAHCEIFSLEPDSVIVVMALRGPFYERAVEVADASRRIGARVIGVSNDPAFADHADLPIGIGTGGFDDLAASLAIVPLQWLAVYDAVRRGEDPDLVRHKAVNSPLIRQAPIWEAEQYGHAGIADAMSAPTGGSR